MTQTIMSVPLSPMHVLPQTQRRFIFRSTSSKHLIMLWWHSVTFITIPSDSIITEYIVRNTDFFSLMIFGGLTSKYEKARAE